VGKDQCLDHHLVGRALLPESAADEMMMRLNRIETDDRQENSSAATGTLVGPRTPDI